MPFLTRWNNDFGLGDFDRTFLALDELRRRMGRAFEDVAGQSDYFPSSGANWPPANLYDSGSELIIKVELPGVSEKDIDLQMNQDVITISGTRSAEVPEGYSAHRKERPALKFSRSFSMPFRTDPEKCSALLKNGILTVSLAKSPEAQPRQITVKAG